MPRSGSHSSGAILTRTWLRNRRQIWLIDPVKFKTVKIWTPWDWSTGGRAAGQCRLLDKLHGHLRRLLAGGERAEGAPNGRRHLQSHSHSIIFGLWFLGGLSWVPLAGYTRTMSLPTLAQEALTWTSHTLGLHPVFLSKLVLHEVQPSYSALCCTRSM